MLIAPLDWGLGHTTRCIPLIRCMQQLGHVVVFAGNEWQRAFIEQTFPAIENIHLEGYNVIYGATSGLEKVSLLSQVPRLRLTIKKEHAWLQEHIAAIRPDAIISDNRYGIYHSSVPSVIMTHQLQIQTGMGNAMNRAVQKMHYKFLERFDNVWVPDTAGTNNLAGALSHTSPLPKNTSYLGLLSQFDAGEANTDEHLLVLLSGPEPQRTMLANILWQQAVQHKGKVIFVAGTEQVARPLHIPEHITYYERISGSVLKTAIQKASMVICRSGYSTIMDLMQLSKKAILIPTPGQTEQEYMARHLQQQGIFPYALQKGFDLEKALSSSVDFPYHLPKLAAHFHDHEAILEKLLASI